MAEENFDPGTSPVTGEIIVTYALPKDAVADVRKALGRFLDEKTLTADEIAWRHFEPVPAEWTERDPKKRLEHFKQLLPSLQEHQEPIFSTSITSLSAEFQEGELLPFVFLCVRYGLQLSKEPESANSGRNLVSLTQWCRDIATALIGGRPAGVPEILVVTSETVSDNDLEKMREQTRLLQTDHANWDGLVPADAMFNDAPPGTREGSGSFAHLLVARNIHGVLGPLSQIKYTGPGWIFHFYESDAFPHSSLKTASLNFIDPLRQDFFGGYVKNRITGLPLLFALWQWLGFEQYNIRAVRRQLATAERRLSKQLWRLPTLFSWRSLAKRAGECRVRLYGLRALRDEYEPEMKAYMENRRSPPGREIVVLSKEDREANPGKIPAGPSLEFVDAALRQLSRSLNEAEEAYAYASAQQENYKVRLERGLAILLAIFGAAQLWEILRDTGAWAALAEFWESLVLDWLPIR